MMLRTHRPDVVLRAAQAGDADALADIVAASAEHLTQHGDYADLVAGDAAAIAATLTGNEKQFVMLLNDTIVGLATLIRYQPGIFGLGYWIGAAASGQGVTGAAVRRLVEHAVSDHGATEVWAGIRATNIPSIRLVQRLGFTQEREAETHLSFVLRTP